MTASLGSTGRTGPGRLLPEDARHYPGLALVLVVLGVYSLVLTGRSLVHIFVPDGGAESIATIDTGVVGGDSIIAVFGQWGVSQLMLSAVVWVVLWRYRGLAPLMTLVLFVEVLLREGVGLLKPLETMGTAPEGVGNYILAPLVYRSWR